MVLLHAESNDMQVKSHFIFNDFCSASIPAFLETSLTLNQME